MNEECFENCFELAEIVIPPNIKSISTNAFYRCQSLTNVSIPSSVTNISPNAFRNCIKLAQISIPSSVNSIKKNVFEKYKELKANIPPEKQKQVFTYHGTPLGNHQSIIIKHFLMPGQDRIKHMTDSGYFGKGIASTDNIFYASMYSKGFSKLKYNEKTSLLACLSIFNESYTKHIYDLSYNGKPIDQNITDRYGINYSFSGSSNSFHPILESDKDKNFISAGEFVFPNKYQIIPFYSFSVMRADHYILWIDENIEKPPYSNLMNELLKRIFVNIYSAKSIDEAIQIVNLKKRNRIKLIISVIY